MESNKKDLEFDFLEAEMVKRTSIFDDCQNIVVGKGNLNADILFIGEAAGKNLDKLLERVGLSINDIYVVNILKCRPPKNRDPLPEEIKAHVPWFLKQIKEMRPRIVCSLGNYATKYFLSEGRVEDMRKMPGITEVHGKILEIELEGVRFNLIPLFHPAAIIYNRNKLTPLWEADMEIVKREVSAA